LAAKLTTKFPDLPTLQRVAQQQNATLVEYSIIDTIIGDPALYIWVIQPSGQLHFRQIDLSTQSLALPNLVQDTRQTLGVRHRSSFDFVPVDIESTDRLQQLHQLLIDPIAHLLPTNPNAKVIFIPQDELFLVPFPALQEENDQYLIEKHTILTAPSVQLLDLTAQQRIQQGRDKANPDPLQAQDLLIVGNPTMPKTWHPADDAPQQLSELPGAEIEARTIAQLFQSTPLIGDAASEAIVREKMQQARVVHLATHGLLEYGRPEDSGVRDTPGAIALAPTATEDGLLTATEIFNLKLNAELVVLSACDTGRGRISGDGIQGLSRSLIIAGTPSVIVSLWSVPDAPTASLMTEFYRQWQREGLDKAQALRQAMLQTKAYHPNPRDWAAFTLIGEAQ
jgi:CHAT domain-containing protein